MAAHLKNINEGVEAVETDWKLIGGLGGFLSLVTAAFVGKKFYGRKTATPETE